MQYNKPPLTIQDQVLLLQRRGLNIPDSQKAEDVLKTLGYYRLSAYFIPFYNPGQDRHEFLTNVCFDDVIKLYHYDRRLRLLFAEALGRIEIAIRATTCDSLCLMTSDPFWFQGLGNFKFDFDHADFLKKLKVQLAFSKETFAAHFPKKYSNEYPPSWAVFQAIDFGTCSTIVQNLRKRQLNSIGKHYLLDNSTFKSWVYCLRVLRNHVAHHSRIWNRIFSGKLKHAGDVPSTLMETLDKPNFEILKGYACVIEYFLRHIDTNSDWWIRYVKLTNEFHLRAKHDVIKRKIEHFNLSD